MTDDARELQQHLGWLKIYVEGMTADNWRDMKLRCERQLEAIDGGSQQAEPDKSVSDERALGIAVSICNGKISAIDGAVQIMEYATDAIAAERVFDKAAAQPDKSEPVAWRETEIVRLINVLRSDEGDSVEILCDNPDFNGQPNCAIVCCGDWTGWLHKRFAADAVLDALSMAATERISPSPRKVIAKSNGHHWVQRFNLVCCRDCGFVRRADDQNKPCNGPVGIGIRRDLLPATQQAPPDVRDAFRNVDEIDWKHLIWFIPDSGHGRFWKEVFAEVRAALSPRTGERK